MGSDDELFRNAMRGVQRLERSERVERRQQPRPPTEPAGPAGAAPLSLSDYGGAVVGRAAGVSDAAIRKLRRGKVPYLRRIDLHGLRSEEARVAVEAFLADACRDACRCVLVITGRGSGSPQQVGVLRDALPGWLMAAPSSAHVLAFCTAQPHDGGLGAFYVLLRRPPVR